MGFELKTASWWEQTGGGKIRCLLCPRSCVIGDGLRGYCQARENCGGSLRSLAYGFPVSIQIDPIEKKPFAEFMPGSWAFSVGTLGCNLGCVFCQNYTLSRGVPPEDLSASRFVAPEAIVQEAARSRCESIAFTYNEPTVWAEYAIDIAKLAREAGLSTVLVSNGYITMDAARDLYPLMDAANIDMKGFSEEFYSEMCGGKLAPVLEAISYYHHLPNSHLELTNLVIPGKNDAPEMIGAFLDWVERELDKTVPLHFSAYRPMHLYRASPPTPPETLRWIKSLAQSRGFNHVHLGNI